MTVAAMEKRRSERAKSVCMKEQMSVHKYKTNQNKMHRIAAVRFKIFFFFMDSLFPRGKLKNYGDHANVSV